MIQALHHHVRGDSTVLEDIQYQIDRLYQGVMPDRFIDDCIKMADKCGLSTEQAAAHALAHAYTMDQVDAKCLTPGGFETLIRSMYSMRDAAQNHQPDNEKVLAAYDRAITNLQECYGRKKEPCYTFQDSWNME